MGDRSSDASVPDAVATNRDDSEGCDAPPEPRAVPMRLQKFLARAGVASRRGSEDLIAAGRVTVGGTVVTGLGTKVDSAVDVVAVDGRVVRLSDTPTYLALNKPLGYVTTMSDPQGRPTVAELVPTEGYPGLFPIGRLDVDTTGLLLFTTDGDLGFRLLHPRFHVPKTYAVVAEGQMSQGDIEALRRGVVLEDGPTAPADVRLVRAGGRSEVTITIREGRKRQVRRMFSAVGHPVAGLSRLTFGPIEVGSLEPGEIRMLTDSEVASLKEAAGVEG